MIYDKVFPIKIKYKLENMRRLFLGKKVKKMDEDVIVLSVKKYDFTNSGGEKVSGCTVHYYPAATFDCVQDDESGVLGLQPLKATFSLEFYERAKKVGIPCSARVHYIMRNFQGSVKLQVDGLDFITNSGEKK